MIDTNKYEGHTPGPWRIVEPSPGEQHHFYRIESETEIDEILEYNTWVAHICVIHNEDDDSRNTFLIADAPLLLEEVKRWRGNWTYLRDWLVKSINNEKTNLTARAFSEMFLQLMDGRDEVSE
tara:strand:+ start:134 stop:502 length:369 start_codon:yes stop_codon:yes gene_type:complete